jgi:hypothetical protein
VPDSSCTIDASDSFTVGRERDILEVSLPFILLSHTARPGDTCDGKMIGTETFERKQHGSLLAKDRIIVMIAHTYRLNTRNESHV